MRLKHSVWRRTSKAYIPMFSWRRQAVEAYLTRGLGLELVGVERDIMAGADFFSFTYIAKVPMPLA